MQPDLSNLNEKITQQRDLIDRITPKIPFYEDYVKDKEQYTADSIVRNQIAETFDGYKEEVSRITSQQFKKGNRDILPQLEELSNYLEKLSRNTRHADFGKGDLSKVKFSDEDKLRLLEFDWRMITEAEGLSDQVEALVDADGQALADGIEACNKSLRTFEKAFDQRKNVLMEVL